ncbi:TRAP transporter small permease subunit [Marinibaculum pumilum]|uniref:TRAP transporter small permease protein n=1 Tax=Marinibaculum pumilum TaxID=1766165 RepID=A0ABV7L0L5_9PROT
MTFLLRVSAGIDGFLSVVARIGAWCGVALVLVVCFDVATRYLGLPKPFGLNSTQVQESEYWLHTFLFALVIGWAYTRQAHVRIDLVRERFGRRTRYAIEIFGIVVFLLTYVAIGTWYTGEYAHASFLEDEASKSTIGLTDIWILKMALPALFLLLGLAGISQLIKSVAGLTGHLPEAKAAETLG